MFLNYASKEVDRNEKFSFVTMNSYFYLNIVTDVIFEMYKYTYISTCEIKILKMNIMYTVKKSAVFAAKSLHRFYDIFIFTNKNDS